MIDPTYAVTRLRHAERLKRSAERLAELCSLAAHALIIEFERQLLAQTLILFPVDFDAQRRAEEMRGQMDVELHSNLLAADYLERRPDCLVGSSG